MVVEEKSHPLTVTQFRATPWQRFVRKATPYFFISPFFIGFAIFSLLPIIFSIYLSFAEWNGMSDIEFTGLDNFITLFKDAKFWNALQISLVITVVCTILGTAGATILAVLLEKVPDRLASLLRVIFFLPAVTSVVVITYVWRQLYSTDYGYFNTLLIRLGLPPQQWLADPDLALGALIVMLIWAGLGWDAWCTAGLRSFRISF
jgi:ABC-type sugar transport system permease subunit